ncbi:MAG TPA: hypothetical protein PKA49_14730 [Tepidiformaceae bacterium]|nr:hypothetical protein [Tepidiformaceae bacterium]
MAALLPEDNHVAGFNLVALRPDGDGDRPEREGVAHAASSDDRRTDGAERFEHDDGEHRRKQRHRQPLRNRPGGDRRASRARASELRCHPRGH